MELSAAKLLWRKCLDFLAREFSIAAAREEFSVLDCWQDELGMSHFRLQQIYQQLRVVNEIFIVHITAENEVRDITGNYRRINNIDIKPTLTPAQAAEIAQRETGEKEKSTAQQLVIFFDGDTAKLAYEVILPVWQNNRPMNLLCYLDAHSGALITKHPTTGKGSAIEASEIARQLNSLTEL